MANNQEVDDQKSKFHLPSSEDKQHIIKVLKLTKEKSEILFSTLEYIDEQLDIYEQILDRRPDRKKMVVKLDAFYEMIISLRKFIEDNKEDLINFLPRASLLNMAETLTLGAVGLSVGKNLYPKDLNAELKIFEKKQNRPTSYEDLELMYASRKSDYGLTHPSALIVHFLNTLIFPVEELLASRNELTRKDYHMDPHRRFFIQNLAQIAKSILGEDPPIKKSGDFVELCEITASACGLSTKGIDSAIVTILPELREAGIIKSPTDKKID